MITLYHSPTTRSFRIKWLLEELGLDYKTVVVDFYNDERLRPEFTHINPISSLPAM